MRHDPTALTPRETEAVRLLAFGPDTTNRGIAGVMGVSDRTVETYLALARDKIGCRNRVQLLVWAIQNLEPEEAGAGGD